MPRSKKIIVLDTPDQVTSYVEKPAVVEEVVLDGNQQVVTDKKTKAALMQSEKKAAKVKTVKPKATTSPSGHARITVDLILQVLEDSKTMKRPEIAEKRNLGTGAVADIIAGSPYIKKMLHKQGLVHPRGPYVKYIRPAKKSNESTDSESEIIDGTVYHKGE